MESSGCFDCARERVERVQKRLAAALRHIDVFLDEALIVRLVGQADADKRQLVLDGKRLPHRVVDLAAAVAIRSWNEEHGRLHRRDAVRQPEL